MEYTQAQIDHVIGRSQNVLRKLYINNDTGDFTRELNELRSLKDRVDNYLYDKEYLTRWRRKYMKDFSSDLSVENDILISVRPESYNNMFLHLGNVLMCAMSNEMKCDEIQYKLYYNARMRCIDIKEWLDDVVLYKVVSSWIQKSSILEAEFMRGVKNIRIGLILGVSVLMDGTSDGHEIFICIDKIKDTTHKYHLYIFDNLDSDSYEYHDGRRNFHQTIAHHVSLCMKRAGIDIFVKFVRVSVLIIQPVTGTRELIPSADNPHIAVFGDMEYTCMSVARRMALYAGSITHIYDQTFFDEISNPYFFYQHYISFLTQMYRMIEWLCQSRLIWLSVEQEAENMNKRHELDMNIQFYGMSQEYRQQLDRFERLGIAYVFPSHAFFVNEAPRDIYKRTDDRFIADSVVEMLPEHAYVRLIEPARHADGQKEEVSLYFQRYGPVFSTQSRSTCVVSKQFQYFRALP